jgi:hypothetical protein
MSGELENATHVLVECLETDVWENYILESLKLLKSWCSRKFCYKIDITEELNIPLHVL